MGTESQVAGENVPPKPTEAAGAEESTQERTSSVWMERKSEEVKGGREEIGRPKRANLAAGHDTQHQTEKAECDQQGTEASRVTAAKA